MAELEVLALDDKPNLAVCELTEIFPVSWFELVFRPATRAETEVLRKSEGRIMATKTILICDKCGKEDAISFRHFVGPGGVHEPSTYSAEICPACMKNYIEALLSTSHTRMRERLSLFPSYRVEPQDEKADQERFEKCVAP